MNTPAAFPTSLELEHGTLQFPVFLPDATFAVVRAVDSTTIHALGGLHQMSAWGKPIITDSGGFQAYSLIRQNARYGSMNDNGITFQPESGRRFLLTPEKSIQLQMAYGADVLICLDDCTHSDAPRAEQERSVKRTIAWATRARREFDRLLKQKKLENKNRPLLFGVIQGGGEPDLRRECAARLLELGFDGFGFGGWPLDSKGELLDDILSLVRSLIPAQYPIHALGIGHPRNIAACWKLGYGIYDCAMPTRDARHGRLYTFQNDPTRSADFLAFYYVDNERNMKTSLPVEEDCDCPSCRTYSRGYLRHLYLIDDHLYHRLATLHNLRFMTRLCAKLRGEQA
jgi:queuine tRNA-ribosyltransferase